MTSHDPAPHRTDSAASSSPAPPVPEPSDERSAQDLAALMFKPPLDPVRRIPRAPGPTLARPRPGLAPQLPHVYGARPLPVPDAAPVASAGPPLATGPERTAQRSMARQNRRFRWLALGGGAAVLVTVAGGFWMLARLAAAWL